MPFLNHFTGLLAGLTLVGSALAYHPKDFESPLTRVAFGSCNRQNLPQPLWPVIADTQPDLWIWAGDNVYGDSYDPEVIQKKYTQQFENEAYALFRKATPIIGTWDDHDYGANDADQRYPIKQLTRDIALNFMEVPPEDPRRSREGLYGSYSFGPSGKRVKVLLIDGRYFSTGPKVAEPELLGDAQRAWLKQELSNSDAQVHLIVSGIQIISSEHNYEKWANFPATREWLFNLIRETQAPGVLFLSGDRHIHEISVLQDEALDAPLIDITSSGLTHSWTSFKGEPNRFRKGTTHTGLGFGLIELDWREAEVEVKAMLRNKANETVNEVSVVFPR